MMARWMISETVATRRLLTAFDFRSARGARRTLESLTDDDTAVRRATPALTRRVLMAQHAASLKGGMAQLAVVRRWYDELWDGWKVEIADSLFTDDYRLHIPGQPTFEKQAVKPVVHMFQRAFPGPETYHP